MDSSPWLSATLLENILRVVCICNGFPSVSSLPSINSRQINTHFKQALTSCPSLSLSLPLTVSVLFHSFFSLKSNCSKLQNYITILLKCCLLPDLACGSHVVYWSHEFLLMSDLCLSTWQENTQNSAIWTSQCSEANLRIS